MSLVFQVNIKQLFELQRLKDINPILVLMRIVKPQKEWQLAPHAEEVASATMVAGLDRIEDLIPNSKSLCNGLQFEHQPQSLF